MVSQVAESLYWMGRYLERAEDITRLLLVTEDVASEIQGFDEGLARSQWADLSAIFPGSFVVQGPRKRRHAVRLSYESAFFTDRHNPYSVFNCLKEARDNAWSVREVLTMEVFLNLNEAYREVEGYTQSRLTNPTRLTNALTSAEKGILTTIGAIEYTLSRDQSWLFLKLAESLERVFRTACILKVKLPSLRVAPQDSRVTLHHTQLRALLRDLSSWENHSQSSGVLIDPERVVRYVLFDGYLPRSLRCGVLAVKTYLERLFGGAEVSPPTRIIGKLYSELIYEDERIVKPRNLPKFLDDAVREIADCDEAISRTYFLA